MIIESTDFINIQVGQMNDLSSDSYMAFPADTLGLQYYVVTYLYKHNSVFMQVSEYVETLTSAYILQFQLNNTDCILKY